jgi:putative heme-binding domain-containing protein
MYQKHFLRAGVFFLTVFCLALVLHAQSSQPTTRRARRTDTRSGIATPAEKLTILPGFKIELLYSVPKDQDSWVSMATDPKGRLIASGQSGPLYRITPGADAKSTKVEKLDIAIGHAQGLLYAFDSLYVMVNGKGIGGHGGGFYRCKSPDGGETYGEPELLLKLNAAGEHGPHAIRLGPDGKLYVLAGNFTDLPKDLEPTSPVKNYAEDQLTMRDPDGNGFATGRMAPSAWIIRCDENGKHLELFCAGYRNPYDMNFNTDGELFTWDSDMEWDIGAPWYRPTRICMAMSGGDFGYRFGTGPWPDYCEDSLPPVCNTGLGSPTGLTFGTNAKFPAKFQHALYGEDWAYGKILVFYVVPDGAGYKATFETFISGKPFDPTAMLVDPKDGAMYLTIGGRNTQSGLYRVTYTGSESTSPASPDIDPKTAEARATRHKLESFHGRQDSQAIGFAWDYLNSPDRYLRYAARIVVESQPVAKWQERALNEKRPLASLEALLALSRCGDRSLQPRVLESLARLHLSTLTPQELLIALRTFGLCFTRMGNPDPSEIHSLQTKFDTLFPSTDKFVNRELSRLLAYLDAPGLVDKCMNQLAKAQTQEDQLWYVFILRNRKDGWTPEQRKAWFSWLNLAEEKYHGGASFKNYLKHFRTEAEKTLAPDELKELADVINKKANVDVVKVTAPRQFVRNWQMQDILPDIDDTNHGRSFKRGKAAFEALQCVQCHKFKDEGDGSIGPDLTAVGNRFGADYVLESILQPSKVVSDQYANTQIVTNDGDVVVGRVMQEDADKLIVRPSPLSEATVTVEKNQIKRRELSKLSPMPEGLADLLEKDEILDMIAYLRSGGNPDDKAFKQ